MGYRRPVAYGQCDGGICFTSTSNKTFPGFDGKLHKEIVCSCPISTETTLGSTDPFGYQVFGPYFPDALPGERCDASGCAACSVPDPSANGSFIQVASKASPVPGSPRGTSMGPPSFRRTGLQRRFAKQIRLQQRQAEDPEAALAW